MSRPTAACVLTAVIVLSLVGVSSAESTNRAAAEAESIGAQLPVWSAIPFAGILLSIALFPLFAPRWWHRHFPKVSAFWALLAAVPLVIAYNSRAVDELLHVCLVDYVPFIILLWALFTVAGGIHVKGAPQGAPGFNTLLLGIGTVIASWMGTTGASIVLIRPVLRANAARRHKAHVVVFFIFLVSNIGGALTPLGDPPLFLGFLHGVPFFWTMRLLPHMLIVAAPLLLVFYFVDRHQYRKDEPPKKTAATTSLRIEGAHNLFFLAGIVGAVLMSGIWRPGSVNILGVETQIQNVARDGALLLMGMASIVTTRKQIRKDNEFSWFPMKEVAILFAGIFTTIIPALAILKAGEKGALGGVVATLETPSDYFWITGSLSSFLDNAPSYLTFFNSLLGRFFSELAAHDGILRLVAEKTQYLEAVSAGAVFFGAMTYIGNAPNFMVKSIAEEAGVRMPSFFGFMFKYSIPVLLPLFALVTWVLF